MSTKPDDNADSIKINNIPSLTIFNEIGNNYYRLRIGIGHPGNQKKVHRYVLSDFYKSERDWVNKTVDAIAEALPILIEGDNAGFMTKVAYLAPPPNQKESKTELI